MPPNDFQKLLTSLRHKGLIGKSNVCSLVLNGTLRSHWRLLSEIQISVRVGDTKGHI